MLSYHVITGDCMEAAGICDGDIVVLDRTLRPRMGEICACSVDGTEMVKEYLCPGFVGERRKGRVIQRSYAAEEILGVVVGVLKWRERPPETTPKATDFSWIRPLCTPPSKK